MPREDHVCPVAHPQVVLHLDAALGQFVEFLDDPGRIDYHPAGDHADHVRREHAAGQQRQLVHLAADDDCVTGVGAALVADDEVMLAREEVDDLALGFVAPLQTDNASTWHGRSSKRHRGPATAGRNQGKRISLEAYGVRGQAGDWHSIRYAVILTRRASAVE
jgi:hypothetical protein